MHSSIKFLHDILENLLVSIHERPASILLYRQPQVFRELLQNSDDASATAVEIHFETKEYLDRKNSKETPFEDSGLLGTDGLPDLKTAVVRALCTAHCSTDPYRALGSSVDIQKQRHCLQGRRLESTEEDRLAPNSLFS